MSRTVIRIFFCVGAVLAILDSSSSFAAPFGAEVSFPSVGCYGTFNDGQYGVLQEASPYGIMGVLGYIESCASSPYTGHGVYGQNLTNYGSGVYGYASSSGAAGVRGTSNAGYGVYGSSIQSYAGYFAGQVNATGGYTQVSSRDAKEDIVELTAEEAMAAFNQLAPVKYRYKARNDEVHLGFIAEDVPQLLATKDRKGLSAMDIVAMLTRVVQVQQKEIKELRELFKR